MSSAFLKEGAATGAPAAPVLVERDRELASIAGALDSAIAGSGIVLMVEGEAGIGKSRLLAEARALAEARRMRCLRAHGAELERQFAFGVIRQLLEQELTSEGSERLLAGAAAPVAALLGAPPGPGLPPQDRTFALLHGIYWACARLAEERPTVLLVDDAQWADEPSLRALEYLEQRVEELPLALILAVRRGEAPGRGALVSLAAATRLAPAPLSEAGSARVLGDLLGSATSGFSSAAHRVTGGNPFLLREVALASVTGGVEPDDAGAGQLAELGPGSVASWTLARLDRLPGDARELALSLAVLERAELQLLALHAELDQSRATAASDQLAGIGVIERSLPLRFAHPIVRRALSGQLAPAAGEGAHHRAALLLDKRGASPELVATHLLETEPRGEEWAVAALRAAAAAASARGGTDQAARFLSRAIAEPGRGDDAQLSLELGLARLAANDPGAVEQLEAASRVEGADELRGAINSALAHGRYLAGDTRGAFEAVRTALDAIPPGGGGPVEAQLLISLGVAGRPREELVAEVRRRLEQPRLGGGGELTPAEVVRRHLLSFDSYLRGERRAAGEGARWAAARLAEPAMAEALPSLAGTGPAFVLAGMDAQEEAEEVISRSLERARGRGSRLETAEALNERVWSRWRRGDLAGGLADGETIEALTAGAWEIAKLPVRVACADMLVERGALAEAEARLDLTAELEALAPGTWGWGWLPLGRARLALARGDSGRALELALEAGRRLLAIEAPSPEYCWWRSLAARSADRVGRREQAREIAEEELELARGIGSARAIGIAQATMGVVEGKEAGVELLRAARSALAEAGAELERARALVELGVALRRERHEREAREPLREALDLAGRIGATSLAETSLAELRAAGGRPRRQRSSGIGGLTTRERQVAELAAAGLANPEIAERLFITRKTVEAHLRAVFRKLGISSRGQLRRFL